MSNPTSNILKIISLLLTGTAMLSGTIWGITMKAEEARAYTDTKTEMVRQEGKRDLLSIQEDIGQLKQDTAVIRTIIEERFRGKR